MSRKIRVMSVSFKPDGAGRMLSALGNAMHEDLDLVILPETCLGNRREDIAACTGGAGAAFKDGAGPEAGGGSDTVGAVRKIAADYGANIVFPAYTSCGDAKRINSALVIDRKGEVIASYEKLYPYWSEFDLDPPCAVTGGGDCTAQLDFGRIGLAVCFDANFPPVWQNLRERGAELVVWSSAYSAGMQLAAYSLIHHYPIVTSTMIPDAAVYDIDGRETLYKKGEDICVMECEIDLDRCIFHENFNLDKAARLIKERRGDVEIEKEYWREQWFILRSRKRGVSARALAAEYGMTELTSYQSGSMEKIDAMRVKQP